ARFPANPGSDSRIFVKLVSDSADGQHVMGIFRIGFELFPQAVNVGIDVPRVAFILRAPDSVEQIVALPRASRLRRQQVQDLKLKGSQIDSRSGARDFM